MFRTLTMPQRVADISIASLCWLLALTVYGVGFHGSFFAVTGMAGALALRRWSPPLALGIAWITAIAQVAFSIGPDASNLAILPVLYSTASYGTPMIKWLGFASSGAGALLASGYFSVQSLTIRFQNLSGDNFLRVLPEAVLQFLFIAVLLFSLFVLAWVLGLLAKTWRVARESGQARIIAERERLDAQQTVVVEQERNRIARDMHDVVAHSLAVVIAQADGARYAAASQPQAVDAALATISTTAREALGDVRILLGQLRHSQDAAPQPALADLDRLLEQFRDSGMPVRFEQSGTPHELGMGAQLAVYRIIQEALTNALRHGDREQGATVGLTWSARSLDLAVTNHLAEPRESATVLASAGATAPASAGATEQSHSQGHGLAGMTERAALSGGSLVTRTLNGIFLLEATIPTEAV